MTMMRIAILKETKDGWMEAIAGYNAGQFLSRVLSKMKEKFFHTEGRFKQRWTKGQALKIAEAAIRETFEDLKEETVKLP